MPNILSTKFESLFSEFTDEKRATMSSLNSFGGSIGFAIMSVILGGLADSFGPAKAMIILTIISLPTVYLYWTLFKDGNKVPHAL